MSYKVTKLRNYSRHRKIRQCKKTITFVVASVTFFALFLTIFSCNNSSRASEKIVQNLLSDTLNTENENTGNKIDYGNTKVLKSIVITDRKGTEIKQQADVNSKTLGIYEYGTKLDVIEENEKWIGVRDRVTREFFKDGEKIEHTAWEKVYVLKNKTGSISEIILTPSDLNIISSLKVNQKSEDFTVEKSLTKYLALELIDKSLFDSKKSSAVNFLLADTIGNKKKNGIIELKCQNKIVKYIDKPNAEESLQVFKYKGQIDFLNKYLIKGEYWEWSDCRFIDKTSGEETNIFGEYPYISPNKKNIICIYSNPYDMTADLELYAIFDKEIKHIMSASFKYWMPTGEIGKIFWSSDSYLYLAVNHIYSFWKEDGSLNDKYQYIRIKIL